MNIRKQCFITNYSQRIIQNILKPTSSLQEHAELLSVEKSVVELREAEAGQGSWASVGVRIPPEDRDDGDSL